MTSFRTVASTPLSVGGTAEEHLVPRTAEATGGAPDVRHAAHAEIVNTHASQTIYARRNGVATTSVYDLAVTAGQSGIIALGKSDRLSLIASGATTTGELHWGSAI